jgi:lipopolysaccharide/colanic/teichoic acid biosynthesis glycosyltransferase
MKRTVDLLLAVAGLVALSPLLLALAVWVKLDSRGPVFFRGWRAGRMGKPFRVYKFRTMVTDPAEPGGAWTSSGDPRITRAGRTLRRCKLDELPQLINVLAGDMSFVGPRPEVLDEVQRYTAEEKQLLTVRPGITDWSSIKFSQEGDILRNSSDPQRAYSTEIRPEKIRLGLQYVHNHSLRIDAQILVSTARCLVHAALNHRPKATQ